MLFHWKHSSLIVPIQTKELDVKFVMPLTLSNHFVNFFHSILFGDLLWKCEKFFFDILEKMFFKVYLEWAPVNFMLTRINCELYWDIFGTKHFFITFWRYFEGILLQWVSILYSNLDKQLFCASQKCCCIFNKLIIWTSKSAVFVGFSFNIKYPHIENF